MLQPRSDKLLLTGLISLCWMGWTGASAFSQDHEAAFLRQLRTRQLFSLAEKYCRDWLREKIPPEHQTALVLELSETLTEHGKYQVRAEQARSWQEADAILTTWYEKIPDAALRQKLAAQRALNLSRQATFLRWQADVDPHDSPLRAAAKSRIAAAIEALTAVSNDIDKKRTLAYRHQRLRDVVQAHMCEMLLNRARVEPPGSADRIGAVIEAEQLSKRLAVRAADNNTKAFARVIAAACASERGQLDRAETLLDEAGQRATDETTRDRIVAERLRVLLENRQPDRAGDLIIEWRRKRGRLSGELHVLKLQTLKELWRAARLQNKADVASQFLRQMDLGVAAARAEVGGYWALRCLRLREAVTDIARVGEKTAGLKRQAEQEILARNYDAALNTLAKGVAQAKADHRTEAAADLEYLRGSVLIRTQRFADAAAAFQASVSHRSAAHEAHLMWAWCLGRVYQQTATRENRIAYTHALDEHTTRFPKEATFSDAAYMLGALEESRLQNTRAIEQYKRVSVSHKKHDDAAAGVARCYSAILDRLLKLNRPAQLKTWRRRAEADVVPQIAGLSEKPSFNGPQAEFAAYAVAIIARHHVGGDAARANVGPLTRRAERYVSELPEPNERGTKVAKILRQSRAFFAAGTSTPPTNLQDLSTAELFSLLQTLTRGADRTPRANEARLNAALALAGRKDELTPRRKSQVDEWTITAYLAAGRLAEGLRLCDKQLKKRVDVASMTQTARAIEAIDSQQAAQLSLRAWKRVEAASRAGSESWLTSRLQLGHAYLRLGQSEECRKIVRVTRLLYPDLGGQKLSVAFRGLEARLKNEP